MTLLPSDISPARDALSEPRDLDRHSRRPNRQAAGSAQKGRNRLS